MTPDMIGRDRATAEVPSMLDLVNLSRRPLFPPGGVELYRHIAVLTEMTSTDEVLVVPSGLAVTLQYFVTEYDVHASGVEDDPVLLEESERRLRTLGLLDRVHLQSGEMDGLPFRDGIFDVVVADLGLTSRVNPGTAVQELVRVAKVGATVVIVQPVWKAPVDPLRQAVLSDYLGCRPLMLVEWKRILKSAGLVQLHTENWSDEETAFRPQVAKPFPDFTELFSVGEKVGILRRARQRWGWLAVLTAVAREREVHRMLTHERVLGLDLVKGIKAGEVSEEAGGAAGPPAAPPRRGTPSAADDLVSEADAEAGRAHEVTGLPLFGDGGDA